MFSLTRNIATKLVVKANRATAIKAQFSTTPIVREHNESDPMLQVGPYPRTKEERIRAAKKYNLIPEDYEPYPEEEAMGDYPMLKAVGNYNRDWYDDFDDPVGNKFYGEVYHADADLYEWERIDPLADEKKHLPEWLSFLTFIGIAGFIPTMYWLFTTFRIQINHPWKCRHPNPLIREPEPVLYAFPK